MALLVGDIVMLTINSTLFTETMSNVFFYECTDNEDEATLGQMAEVFRISVLNEWVELLSEDVTFTSIRMDNLTNELDFSVLDLAEVGLTLSPSASSAVAGAISLTVSSKLTRPGSKRIGGIPEVYVGDNLWVPVTADIDAFLVALVDDLEGEDLDPAVVCLLNPVVVGRFLITEPDTGMIDISRFQSITGAIAKDAITTQTSRRPNRGI